MDKRAASLPPCVKGGLSGLGDLWVGGTGLRCPAGGLALVANFLPAGPPPARTGEAASSLVFLLTPSATASASIAASISISCKAASSASSWESSFWRQNGQSCIGQPCFNRYCCNQSAWHTCEQESRLGEHKCFSASSAKPSPQTSHVAMSRKRLLLQLELDGAAWVPESTCQCVVSWSYLSDLPLQSQAWYRLHATKLALMHAALRGQPEQCENVQMPSTSLSFNTSVARSEFFNLATWSKTAWPSVQKDCFLEVSCDWEHNIVHAIETHRSQWTKPGRR